MSAGRFDHASLLTEEMRAPLSRIQLAASELARSSVTPHARELAERIASAVEDIDGLALAIRSVLLPRPAGRAPMEADVRPQLEDLYERLVHAVEARGQAWWPPELPSHAVLGDPVRTRHAGITLIRAATEIGGRGACLRLGLVSSADRVGVRVDVEAPQGAAAPEWSVADLGPVQQLALSRGGEVEVGSDEERTSLCVWLPRGADA